MKSVQFFFGGKNILLVFRFANRTNILARRGVVFTGNRELQKDKKYI